MIWLPRYLFYQTTVMHFLLRSDLHERSVQNVILEIFSSLVQFIYSAQFLYFRGISSTVRRCIEKETGIEFAAKIIDLSNDSHDGGGEGKTMLEATIEEVKILRLVAGHPYISKYCQDTVYIYFDHQYAWQPTDSGFFFSRNAWCLWVKHFHIPCIWVV